MNAYRVIGIESSPYAVKVRAVMRYRRLPHIWVARMPQFFEETQAVRPLLMPVVQFPDGAYRTDSTTIIRELEGRHPGERSVMPGDPGLAFLSDLIEDMADEWLTKCLFHYRFSNALDRKTAAAWVMDDAHPHLSVDELAARTDAFIDRQVNRMPLVGCTPANAPLLEASYKAVLACLEPFVATDRFLFGTRPSLADFGLYAQLKTLRSDPTPGAIMREMAPRTWHWIGRVDDASGVNGTWDRSDDVSPAAEGLLRLAGTYYLPYLAANGRAMDAGADTVEVDLAGHPYSQPVFRFHGKCWSYLRHAYGALADTTRQQLSSLLERTGCLEVLAG